MEVFKLLMIDDEPNYPTAFKYYLESKGNFKVNIAVSGEEGIESAKKEKPDLIFLDVMMPGIDGIATLKILKSVEELKDIPVVMLTAVETERAMSEAKKYEVAAYMKKPLDIDLMVAKIEEIKNKKDIIKN